VKILATGATGRFAHPIVTALVRSGVEVRAVVHDAAKSAMVRRLGAHEIVQADLGDPDSLRDALRGIDGAFLITPAFHPQATQFGLNLIDAAVKASVSKIVYNGVYHPSLSLVNHASTRPVEEALYSSDLDFTVLQPAMYLQAIDQAYRQALQTGAVVMPWSARSKMTYVDYRDVADAVAIAFTDSRLSGGTFELAAGGMIDRIELAELMSRAAGRELVAADPPARPQRVADGLAAMFDHYSRYGFHGGNPLALRTILEREPRSVAAYVAELARANADVRLRFSAGVRPGGG
jgi:uncharacterized protein YbjT (DUF2867 family)